MEKINFKNSKGLNLVGNFYSANSKLGIICLHGFTGDKSENGRINQVAERLNKEGFNVLSFDFSGCGESDDDSLTVDKQVDDLKCAINWIKTKNLSSIGIFGISLGGLVALKVKDLKIKTMVLWAPVTDKVKYSWDKRYSKESLEELKEKGYITYSKNSDIRKKVIIDKQMLKDRESVNQKELLSNIKLPLLIIHGDSDTVVPFEDSKNAMKYLSKTSNLEIIPNENHNLLGKLDKIIELTNSWFKKYLF